LQLLRWIILFFVVAVSTCSAEGVSLNVYLDSLIAEHPLVRRQNISPHISEVRREGYAARQDWRARVNPRYSHVEPVSTSPFTPTRIDEWRLDASLSRAIWGTGGDLSFQWQSTYTDQEIPTIDIPGPAGSQGISTGVPELFEHSFSLRYTQPLLRNRGGDLDRLQYETSDYDISIADVEAAESIEEFLARMAARYLSWVNLTEQVTIIKERLELARQERQHLEDRYDVNLIDRADLLRAENAYRNVEQQLVLARSRRNAEAARLATLAEWEALADTTPDYDIYRTADLPDVDSAYRMIESDGREVTALRLQRDKLNHQLAAWKETTLPQLDLNVSVGLQGGNDAFSESIEIDDPQYSVGLLLRQQIGAASAEADIRVAELRKRQLLESEDNLLLETRASVRSLLKRMRDMEEVLELNRQTIQSARERWKEERELYREGRGQLVWVIQAQDMEQNARLNYARNATTYHQLLAEFRELTDQLLADSNHEK
jgi:outer membrane protein TolC